MDKDVFAQKLLRGLRRSLRALIAAMDTAFGVPAQQPIPVRARAAARPVPPRRP